jgi:hypothetical protein
VSLTNQRLIDSQNSFGNGFSIAPARQLKHLRLNENPRPRPEKTMGAITGNFDAAVERLMNEHSACERIASSFVSTVAASVVLRSVRDAGIEPATPCV